ncbi:MAG: DNA replication/repair protein RecF [Bacteroidota bacterium]
MHLSALNIAQFKNYATARVICTPGINCFVGKNGSGKTNLLDAIYYLSFTKSYFNAQDQFNIKHDEPWLRIEGNYKRNEMEEQVSLFVQRGERKVLKVNNNEPKKFSDHIGHLPLVMITPNDIMLIQESSEERRKFLDGMISQTDKVYLSNLLMYNRVLEHRNRQLKNYQEGQSFDPVLFETYNEQLCNAGKLIYETRKAFLDKFIHVFRVFYQDMASTDEWVNIVYESDINHEPFDLLIKRSEHSDMMAGRTTKGIHKDDIGFFIGDYALKKFGSQGQQKSFIIALKLAQYNYLKQLTGVKPLLLLDDIFEKLDAYRLERLLMMIAEDTFGQIFVSDTHLERLQQVFSSIPAHVKYFNIDNGIINEI